MKRIFYLTAGVFLLTLCIFSSAYSQEKPTNITLPKAVSFPDPVYPPEARQAGLGGEVTMQVKVDKKGGVSVEQAYGPNAPCSALDDRRTEMIRKAAVKAAKKAVFEPHMKNGKPTDIGLQLKYTFDPTPGPRPEPVEDAQMVMGGVLTGKALSLPIPQLPSGARANRIFGAVPVSILFDETGRVVSAAARGGHPQLHYSAIVAACNARFEPVRLSGQLVKVSGTLTYNFAP